MITWIAAVTLAAHRAADLILSTDAYRGIHAATPAERAFYAGRWT